MSVGRESERKLCEVLSWSSAQQKMEMDTFERLIAGENKSGDCESRNCRVQNPQL